MPPRFTYWTIIYGGQPTSFRSGTRDELMPTFKQIQARHPDAQLRYFARGKLWYSEEEAHAALIRERFEKRQRSRPHAPRGGEPERRRPDWRPGGEHKDPRDRFKVPRDVKRARFKDRLRFRDPAAGSRKPGAASWKPKPAGWKPKSGIRKPPPPRGWKPRRPPFKKKDEE